MKQKTNWLKTLREKQGLTQEEFTARLQLEGMDYSRPAISSWESDRHPAPLGNVAFRQALANIFNMDIKTLLKLAGYEVESKPHSEEAERVAYLIDQLPPDKRNLAVRLVEEMAKT
jgi:transcriptional regulator with XRE-family HTH domain